MSAAILVAKADEKISRDLDTVLEKVDLCNSMLRPGGGDRVASISKKEDASVLAVIGFLEACAPRMVQLVEVAAQGSLSESVLMKCLEVNDKLMTAMSDIDSIEIVETAANSDPFGEEFFSNSKVSAATVGDAPSPVAETDDDLFLFDDSKPAAKPAGEAEVVVAAAGAAAAKGSEDPFSDPFGTASVSSNNTPPAVQKSSSDDEFDAFFNDRVGN